MTITVGEHTLTAEPLISTDASRAGADSSTEVGPRHLKAVGISKWEEDEWRRDPVEPPVVRPPAERAGDPAEAVDEAGFVLELRPRCCSMRPAGAELT